MSASSWDDLRPRVVSGIAMAAVGLLGAVLGGVWFQMLAVFVTAIMVWELWMMISPDAPVPGMLLAVGVGTVLSGIFASPTIWPLALVLPLLGALRLTRERLLFFAFAGAIMLAGWGLISLRADQGLAWLLWLILVVVMTDVAGYFAGRFLGGRKFWPAISPKKTWSGTVAGWVGSAVLGWAFYAFGLAGAGLILISVLVSFASQMGDIAESALKRRMGVKDSSDLIPGHGGLFDRFDGLLAASIAMVCAKLVFTMPQVAP